MKTATHVDVIHKIRPDHTEFRKKRPSIRLPMAGPISL